MTVYLLVSGLVLLNLLVSACVFRDGRRSRSEKIAETVLIWLLPVLGSVLTLCSYCRDPQREQELREIEQEFHTHM